MSAASPGSSFPALTVAELVEAGRDVAVPFRLGATLANEASGGLNGSAIDCVEILRLLPGRRLVARARVGATACIVKLFMGEGARRYRERERRGLLCLSECGVATPRLLAMVEIPGSEAAGLVLEWLADVEPVSEHDHHAFVCIVGALALLHRHRATQSDPHLENYLKSADGRVYAVDGGGVRRWPVLPRRRALGNLGLLLAQLAPLDDARMVAACAEYSRKRWQISMNDVYLLEVRRHLRRQRRRRARRYLRKTLRECTQFHCQRSAGRFLVCMRDAWNPAMADFCEAPDNAFVDAEVLKAGNSATVVRAGIGERVYVIKRYNVKSFSHGLRRALMPVPRYRRSWLNGHRLAQLGVPTARPVALVERRTGPFAKVAYLVMDDLSAPRGDIRDLATAVAQRGVTPDLAKTVAALFRTLADAEVVHGDTKASNFIVSGDDVYVIDLDAMAESRRGLADDVTRFLDNWGGCPQALAEFRTAFRAAGLPL